MISATDIHALNSNNLHHQ